MPIYISKFSQDKKFYVYQYLRKNKSLYGEVNSPYYIGKGCGWRATTKFHHVVKPPIDKNKISISTLMTEADAFQLEILQIYLFGRIDIGTGCLRNTTNGGDGISGYRHTAETKLKLSLSRTGEKRKSPSLETRKLLQESHLGKTMTAETKKKLSKLNSGANHPQFGKQKSQETKEKISKTKKGKLLSVEHKKKISKSLKDHFSSR
jgi:hypothetical protein